MPGGWTERLQRYMELLNPNPSRAAKTKFAYTLDRVDREGRRVAGKYLGPDGKPLIRVDGPHSAPAVHYTEYNSVLLVGAGCGLTPMISIMRAAVRYKWAKGFNPNVIRFYWVVRWSDIRSYRWFAEMLETLLKDVASTRAAGNMGVGNYLEINVYVTRVSKDARERNKRLSRGPQFKIKSERDLVARGARSGAAGVGRAGIDADAGFDEGKLLRALRNPVESSRDQSGGANLQRAAVPGQKAPGGRAPNQVGEHIWIWDGRPKWDEIFAEVKRKRPPDVNRVGVLFCGHPAVGKDLKKNCKKHSDLERDIVFKLHKENF